MSFTVRWLPNAEAELAAVWMTSPDKGAVTRAAAEIDRRLTAAAPAEGESRPGGRRITFASPLGVRYRVRGTEVEVTQVWSYLRP